MEFFGVSASRVQLCFSELWGSRGNSYDTLDPTDYYGHGTHTAGIVSADGNYGNGTHDTMGIAPKARIMSTAVLVNLVSPYPDTILEISVFDAMQFCVSPPRDPTNHANVLTMSLGLIPAGCRGRRSGDRRRRT